MLLLATLLPALLQGLSVNSEALIYACTELPPPLNAEIASGLSPADLDPLYPQVAFNLSSRPGAVKRIVLDFKGDVVTGTGEVATTALQRGSEKARASI